MDENLLLTVDVTAGLKDGGTIVINSAKKPSKINLPENFNIVTVDANQIAVKYGLGSRSTPIVNTAILGAFSKATEIVSLDAIEKVIYESVPLYPEKNAEATREAFETMIGGSQ